MRWPWDGVEHGACAMCARLESRTWPAGSILIYCRVCAHETPAMHIYGSARSGYPARVRGPRRHWNRCLVCLWLFPTLAPGAVQERRRMRGLERAGQGRLAL